MEDTKRLSKEDWLNAALVALEEAGPSALRADVLSERLGVSRGSFYWHFENVDAFHQAVLERWEVTAVDLPYLSAKAGDDKPALQILRHLIEQAMSAKIGREAAVVAWASQSALARETVDRVNRRRCTILQDLLQAAGSAPDESRAMAWILCATYLGRTQMVGQAADPLAGDILAAKFLPAC